MGDGWNLIQTNPWRNPVAVCKRLEAAVEVHLPTGQWLLIYTDIHRWSPSCLRLSYFEWLKKKQYLDVQRLLRNEIAQKTYNFRSSKWWFCKVLILGVAKFQGWRRVEYLCKALYNQKMMNSWFCLPSFQTNSKLSFLFSFSGESFETANISQVVSFFILLHCSCNCIV